MWAGCAGRCSSLAGLAYRGGVDGAVGRFSQVVIDCDDPGTLAAFWGALLGLEVTRHDPDWATLDDQRTGVAVAFQRVPERKQAKNRLHLDIEVRDLDEAVARGVALGAVVVGPIVYDEDGPFHVFADPEGNEFCLVGLARPVVPAIDELPAQTTASPHLLRPIGRVESSPVDAAAAPKQGNEGAVLSSNRGFLEQIP